MEAKVYIAILNWNRPKDTIECLESVLKLDYPDFQVILCDNGSTDDSIEQFKNWAVGRTKLEEYCPGLEKDDQNRLKEVKIILIANGKNLGFAAGNNVAFRYALERNDFGSIWLLNNDTAVDTMSLQNLVNRAKIDSKLGLIGSKVCYFHQKDVIQALGGGTYGPILAVSRHYGQGLASDSPIDEEAVEQKLDYIVGTSMLITKDFLKVIGLMSEDYFLYFEELDWSTRSRGRFKLGFAADSIVYHKEGATVGSSDSPLVKQKSLTADYYGLKNRLLFTRKFYPWFLPTVWLGILFGAGLNRIIRGQFNRLTLILKILFGLPVKLST